MQVLQHFSVKLGTGYTTQDADQVRIKPHLENSQWAFVCGLFQSPVPVLIYSCSCYFMDLYESCPWQAREKHGDNVLPTEKGKPPAKFCHCIQRLKMQRLQAYYKSTSDCCLANSLSAHRNSLLVAGPEAVWRLLGQGKHQCFWNLPLYDHKLYTENISFYAWSSQ